MRRGVQVNCLQNFCSTLQVPPKFLACVRAVGQPENKQQFEYYWPEASHLQGQEHFADTLVDQVPENHYWQAEFVYGKKGSSHVVSALSGQDVLLTMSGHKKKHAQTRLGMGRQQLATAVIGVELGLVQSQRQPRPWSRLRAPPGHLQLFSC